MVLLNLMSFLKPSKLGNYTQIFIQFHFSIEKQCWKLTWFKTKRESNEMCAFCNCSMLCQTKFTVQLNNLILKKIVK